MSRLAVAAVVLAGCVDHGPGPQPRKIEASYVRDNLVAQVPADVTRVGVSLGGKVEYVGNRVERTSWIPGQSLRVVHYWRVIEPIGPDWRVFAFVRGAPSTADFMNLEATDMELGHPVGSWKPGEIIQDTQDIVLRPDWKSPTATLYVGLIETGGHDLGDRMPAAGAAVEDRAVIARTMPVDLSKAPPPQGTIYVPRAVGAISIDGIANDVGWATAVTSPDFATAEGSPEPLGRAFAKMTWNEQYLYLFVSITDSDIFSEYTKHDDPLWKADCVEIFIDADGNRRGYVELQVNPNNATFDKWWPATRAQPGDESWDSGMVTAVKLKKNGDADQGWDVEIEIPWAAVKGKDPQMAVRLPPEVGDRWRMNVVRVDVRKGGKDAAAASWNRITFADFHALDRMLTIVFADAQGNITKTAGTPPPAPAGSGSAAGSGSGSAATPATHKLLLPGSAARP